MTSLMKNDYNEESIIEKRPIYRLKKTMKADTGILLNALNLLLVSYTHTNSIEMTWGKIDGLISDPDWIPV